MRAIPLDLKTNEDLAQEWDKVADLRERQIASGSDISYTRVLVPAIFRLLADRPYPTILDVGCGVGFLSAELAGMSSVLGVDLSPESIKHARERFKHITTLSFMEGDLVQLVAMGAIAPHEAIVAHMTLMTTLQLDELLEAIGRTLEPGGAFVFTITHPWFWAFYWGYAQSDWFDYSKPQAIEAPFRISNDSDNELITTHVHHPLEDYIHAFEKAGMVLEVLDELMPTSEVEKLYPQAWEYPRFIAGRCRKLE